MDVRLTIPCGKRIALSTWNFGTDQVQVLRHANASRPRKDSTARQTPRLHRYQMGIVAGPVRRMGTWQLSLGVLPKRVIGESE